MVLAASALWWALFDREARHTDPFLPVELLREPSIARMALTVVCFGACMFSVVFFLPIFLQLGQGASVRDSGLLLLPVTIGIVVGSTITGRIVARFGRPFAMPVAGLSIASAALAALALLPLPMLVLAALGFLCGSGLGTVMPTAQIVTQWLAGRERLGAAAAVVTLSRATGAALGTALFGAVVFALLPGLDPNLANIVAKAAATGPRPGNASPAIQYAFRVGFAGSALVALLGAVTASRIRRIHL